MVTGGESFRFAMHFSASSATVLRTSQQVYHLNGCTVTHTVETREREADDWTLLTCIDLTAWDGAQSTLPSATAR